MLPNTKLRLIPLLSIIVLAVITSNYVVRAQNQNTSNWKKQKEELLQRAISVNTIKCNFTIAKFTNPKIRAVTKQAWEKSLEAEPNLRAEPDDSNYLYSYFWIADQIRWRCDKKRVYPQTGHDFSQYLFDGEKYKFFDEYLNRAIVSGVERQLGFVKSLHSNIWLGLNVTDILSSAEAIGLGDFKNTGEETVAGRLCSLYQSSNQNENITFAIDKQNHLLTKFKDVTHGSATYTSIINYEWSDVKIVNGVPIPFKCKLETYDVNNNVTTWVQTVIFQLNDCKVNQPVGQGYFDHVLRVGTDLEDDIENPGRITSVGGDYSQEAEKVKDGVPPNPPELDKDYKKSNAK